ARVPGLLFAEQPPVIFLQVHAHGAPLGQRARTALEDTHVVVAQALPELGADLERGTPGVLDAVHLKRETDVPEAVDRGRTVVLAMTVLVASRGQLHRLPLPLQDWIVVEVPALDA